MLDPTKESEVKTLTPYEVKAYTKTGVYAVVVSADNARAALAKAKPELKRMAFGRITGYAVNAY
jgi:hypothetical protein